jgi:hypothetical protein
MGTTWSVTVVSDRRVDSSAVRRLVEDLGIKALFLIRSPDGGFEERTTSAFNTISSVQ